MGALGSLTTNQNLCSRPRKVIKTNAKKYSKQMSTQALRCNEAFTVTTTLYLKNQRQFSMFHTLSTIK